MTATTAAATRCNTHLFFLGAFLRGTGFSDPRLDFLHFLLALRIFALQKAQGVAVAQGLDSAPTISPP